MSTPTHSTETLRLGHSTRTKGAVALAACVGWLLTYTILFNSSLPALAILPATLGVITSAMLFAVCRTGYTVTIGSLRRTTWRGQTIYLRSGFLSAESMEDNRGRQALLLRFNSGVLFLSDGEGCADPMAVREFVERHWQVAAKERQHSPIGPVMDNLVMQYESLHLVLLAFATLGLVGIAALGPMFWPSAIVAFFTGRAFQYMYRCQRISTNHEGITVTRPLQPAMKIRWDKIKSVRYCYSMTQGYMVLSDGTHAVRVYRWIQNYPRFNRLVQDNVAPGSLPVAQALPWTISLNRRRQLRWLVLLVTAEASFWLMTQGAWPVGLMLMAIPSVTYGFTALASGRKVVVDQESIRLVEKKFFKETSRDYLRADLRDIRLGRQLSAGGLWLKFGRERLEIGNLDSERAPEEILAQLRREWQTEALALSRESQAA